LAVSVGLTCLGIIMFDAAVRFLPILPEPKYLNKPKTEKENSYA
jgi:hypothetical protein